MNYLPYNPSELNVDNWNDECEAKSEARFEALTRFAGQLALCIYICNM